MLNQEQFEKFLKIFKEGISTRLGIIRLNKIKRGRFAEEFNLDISLEEENILTMKVFLGRRPYYGEWVEVFGIKPILKENTPFFGSDVEEKVLNVLSEFFPKIFVEYFEDKLTAIELQRGIPPALSRLGYELLKRGYTYFRDWYIPEGLMEGGHKIQAEKPLNEEIKRRHIEEILREFEKFKRACTDKTLFNRVEKRVKEFLNL